MLIMRTKLVVSQEKNFKLSIIIPLFNEEENVTLLLDKIESDLLEYEENWELILVDDGSMDETPKILRARINKHIRVILLQKNFGQSYAMQVGIEKAQGDIIVTMDGDLQNDSSDIISMIKNLEINQLDVLCGWRKNRQDTIARRFVSSIANKIIGVVTGVKLHDYGCTLKVFRRSILKDIKLYGEMHRFIPAWIATITKISKIEECVVAHHPRKFGTSKYGMSRIFRVIPDLIFMFFFMHYRGRPMHFFGMVAFTISFVSVLLLSMIYWLKLSYFFLFGFFLILVVPLHLLLLGIIAEVVMRIYYSSRAFYKIEFDSRNI